MGGAGRVADPSGMVLWFFALKIRNVILSGRNRGMLFLEINQENALL